MGKQVKSKIRNNSNRFFSFIPCKNASEIDLLNDCAISKLM
jgi:hypothetical protein